MTYRNKIDGKNYFKSSQPTDTKIGLQGQTMPMVNKLKFYYINKIDVLTPVRLK